MYAVVQGIVSGSVSAVGWNLTRYFKKTAVKKQPFVMEKLLQTIVVGALIGALSVWLGMEFLGIETLMMQYGLIAAVDGVVKALLRRFTK